MFERGLGVEVGSAGRTTGDVSFDLPAVRLALVDRMAEPALSWWSIWKPPGAWFDRPPTKSSARGWVDRM